MTTAAELAKELREDAEKRLSPHSSKRMLCVDPRDALAIAAALEEQGKQLLLFRTALENVKKHQEQVGGTMAVIGTTWNIADVALRSAATLTSEVDEFKVGDRVRKSSGYKFPGIVVAAFTTTAGARRYVVECTVPGCEGMLHIFGEPNLAKEPTDAG